jgi:hypothetical protein
MEAHILTLTVKDVQLAVRGIKVLIQSNRSVLELVLAGDLDLDADELRGEIRELEGLLSYLLGHLQAVRKYD